MIPKTHTGVVAQGEGKAAKLGFPTVNIPLADKTISGIYAAEVEAGDIVYRAAAFADPLRGTLEAHLLDFEDNLYGKEITIRLYEKIRDSKAFETDEELAKMIAEDVIKVRFYFAERR